MGTVSLEILRNYILSQGGVVSSQQIVRQFQPFLKDPNNKAHNKELFKSYLSTLTDYRHEPGSNVRILELKKAYRDSPVPQSPTSKENKPRNEATRPGYKDQLQPMRDAQLAQQALQRDPLHDNQSRPPRELEREQSREYLRREQSRERLRREQSRSQLKRDKSSDRAHKEGQREFQRDPQRQLSRDQSREFHKDTRWEQDRTPARQSQPSPRSASRRTAQERRSPAMQRHSPPGAESEQLQENAVITPTKVEQPAIRRASINAINMFNRTAQQKKPAASVKIAEEISEEVNNVFIDKADTLDSNTHEDLREEMESGCSNVPLEQGEKEWIVRSALGDCDTISRLLLTDKNLVYYRDFISGYTGLHWSCKLGRLDMAKILLEAGSEVNQKSNSGHTPLHLAAQTGKSDLIELILRYGADKDVRDHKGKKAGHYLPSDAPEEIKNVLAVRDPHLSNQTNPALRKLSKHQSVGYDLNDNTPKRAQTLNQAWKRYKQSFVIKKKKDGGKFDSNKRDSTMNPRGDSKENHKYGKAQTLPVKQTAIYNF
ncbi:hypothetical protein ACHWQZ_G002584 [Mnemiopsis leidyi]